jgi:hypothetical protein
MIIDMRLINFVIELPPVVFTQKDLCQAFGESTTICKQSEEPDRLPSWLPFQKAKHETRCGPSDLYTKEDMTIISQFLRT